MDARIPCPVCGQQIHPVAGRCKFCKTDLVKLREQRGMRAPRVDAAVMGTQGATPDGALHPQPSPVPVPDPGHNGSNGHTLEAATYAYTPEATRPSIVRRWPILVAIIAGIAIVVCLYLLFFAGDDSSPKRTTTSRGATPAPERMPQAPTPQPPSGGHLPDPWGSQGAPNPPSLPPDFDDPPPPQIDPVPPTPPSNGAVPPAEEFFSAVQELTINKFAQCTWGTSSGNTGLSVDFGKLFGSQGFSDQMREMVRNGRCTYDEQKAQRCLDALSSIDCSSGTLDIAKLGNSIFEFENCATALTCN